MLTNEFKLPVSLRDAAKRGFFKLEKNPKKYGH